MVMHTSALLSEPAFRGSVHVEIPPLGDAAIRMSASGGPCDGPQSSSRGTWSVALWLVDGDLESVSASLRVTSFGRRHVSDNVPRSRAFRKGS